jgi:hypothetical protein
MSRNVSAFIFKPLEKKTNAAPYADGIAAPYADRM